MTQRNFGLDALRALAVAGVLAAHLSIWILETGHWSDDSIAKWAAISFTGGFFGVELFFVLSGYLMGVVAIRDFSSGINLLTLKAYYTKRVMRVVPAYYAAVILLGVAAWTLHSPGPTYRHFIFFYSPTEAEPFFPIGWTLSVQMLFYLIVPFLFLPQKRLALVTAGILTFYAARLLYALYGGGEFEMLHRLPGLRIDGLLVGLLVAVIGHEVPALFRIFTTRFSTIFLAILVMIPAYIMADQFVNHIEIRTHWSPALWANFFLWIPLAIALMLPGLEKHLSAPPLIAKIVMLLSIGSYGFYLVHQDIFALTRKTELIGNAPWGPFIGVPLAFICAYLLYRSVEKPFMQRRKK